MIIFAADNHYGAHPGKNLHDALCKRYEMSFAEDDLRVLNNLSDCDLLILNLIGGTCEVPLADETCERAVRSYCERRGNLLLLHGASAAFWHWPWWRTLVGLRWVRPADPDGVSPSCHPRQPYQLEVAKTRHPLTSRLHAAALPTDEIYIHLEAVTPYLPLLTTTISEGTFVQCCISATPWGGTVVNFLPGHCPEAVAHPDLVHNVALLIEFLRSAK